MTKKANDKLNRRVDAMLKAARDDRDRWTPIYRDGRDYIFFNQLANKRRRDGWDAVECNYIFPAVMQEEGVLMAQRPKLIVQPHEEGDRLACEKLWNGLLQFYFDKEVHMRRLRAMAKLIGAMDGHYTAKYYWDEKPDTGWNAETNEWDGNVMSQMVRADYLLVDPESESPLQENIEFIGTYRQVRLDYALSKWPDFEKELRQAAQDASETHDNIADGFYVTGTSSAVVLGADAVKGEKDHQGDLAHSGRLSSLLAEVMITDTGSQNPDEGDSHVYVLELWFKDREETTETVDEEIPFEQLVEDGTVIPGSGLQFHTLAETGEPLTEANWPHVKYDYERPKYPYGRHILRFGQDTIAVDEPWTYKHWPLVIGQHNPLPFTWHGLNMVEAAMNLQDRVNAIAAHIMNAAKLFGDPWITVERGVLPNDPEVDHPENSLAATAGHVTVVNNGMLQRIKREAPPNMPPSIFQTYELAVSELQDQLGSHEVSRGKQMSGQPTATEVAMLQTNSRIRMGMPIAELDEWTLRSMEVVAELLQANMQPGQVVRIVGEEGNEQNITVEDWMKDAKFDLQLEVGTALPFDKERKQQESQYLFEVLGDPYIEQLLKAFDVPDRAALVESRPFWQWYERILALTEKSGIAPEDVLAYFEQAMAAMQDNGAEGETGGGGGTIQGMEPMPGEPVEEPIGQAAVQRHTPDIAEEVF